jgi:CheY-like chemotaxis protein
VSRLLVVEDHAKDMRVAEQAGAGAGFSEVQKHLSVRSALAHLEEGLRGDTALPDAMLIDLDFGQESGFELLRIRCENPRLLKIPLVVWTMLGPENQQICSLFRIHGYVSKWEGLEVLQQALKEAIAGTSEV